MSRHVRIALTIWPFVFGAFLMISLIKVERLIAPVVDTFYITDLQRDPDGLVVSGYMNKIRQCRFLGVEAEGHSVDGESDLSLVFLDDDTPITKSRPTGSQPWGPWRIRLPKSPEIDSVTLTADHNCHPFWVTQTKLITISIAKG